METLKVIIANNQSKIKIPTGLRMLIRRCCNAVFSSEAVNDSSEVNVTFIDDEEIRRLNKQFRHKDAATDVLSFPLGERGKWDKSPETGAYMIGDIVISMERATEQADRAGHGLKWEVAVLTIHSALHLLGYDHEQGGLEAVQMKEKEEHIIGMIGVTRKD